MPLFPELLYQLSARDQQVTWLDPLFTRNDNTSAATSVTATFTNVNDRVLMLQHVQANIIPGAAQNVASMEIVIRAPGGGISVRLIRSDAALAANVLGNLDWQGSLIVPPSWLVFATGVFNAGAAANSSQLSVGGVFIPVGNIQRV